MFNELTWPRTAGSLTDLPGYGQPLTHQEAHKYLEPVAPRTPDLSNRNVCSRHTKSNALLTELWDQGLRDQGLRDQGLRDQDPTTIKMLTTYIS